MEWIIEHYALILMISGAVVAVGLGISKLTSTTVDDSIFGFLKSLLGMAPKSLGSKEPEEQPGSSTEPLLRERTEVREGDKPSREFLDR